jgi:hypothetical protein
VIERFEPETGAGPLVEDPAKIRIVRLLEPEQCTEFIAKADASPRWHEALSYGGSGGADLVVNPEVRLNWVLQERSAPNLFAPYREIFSEKFARFLDPDREGFFILSLLVANRYEAGGHFHAHVDALAELHRYRRHSVVCYLNDDFTDGGTCFPTLGMTFKPSAGQALIFPSQYLHRANPVTSGRKYGIVFFLCDPLYLTADAWLSSGYAGLGDA